MIEPIAVKRTRRPGDSFLWVFDFSQWDIFASAGPTSATVVTTQVTGPSLTVGSPATNATAKTVSVRISGGGDGGQHLIRVTATNGTDSADGVLDLRTSDR